MEKKAIGFKLEYNVAVLVLMFIGGVSLIVGGILIYVFLIRGAIGGGLAGGCIGGGVYMFSIAINSLRLPNELVHMDAANVYLPRTSISLSQIANVTSKRNAIIITPRSGKKIMQGILKNSSECQQRILDAIQTQQPLNVTQAQPLDAIQTQNLDMTDTQNQE